MKNKPDPALLQPSNLSNEIKKRVPKSRETIPLNINQTQSENKSVGRSVDPKIRIVEILYPFLHISILRKPFSGQEFRRRIQFRQKFVRNLSLIWNFEIRFLIWNYTFYCTLIGLEPKILTSFDFFAHFFYVDTPSHEEFLLYEPELFSLHDSKTIGDI
jgi:hypothetical protein